jgi:hypothetical protein
MVDKPAGENEVADPRIADEKDAHAVTLICDAHQYAA